VKLAFIAAVALAWAAPRPAEACKHPPSCAPIPTMADEHHAWSEVYLKRNQKSVVSGLYTLARSKRPDNVKFAGTAMARADVVGILGATIRCDLDPILRALAANGGEGHNALVALFGASTWADDPKSPHGSELTSALVRATGAVTVTPDIVKLWKQHLKTGRATLVAAAMSENRTSQQSAIELLGVLSDASHDLDRRIDWLRNYVLANRDRAELIAMAMDVHRNKTQPERLRVAAAEVMFDRRVEWYDMCGGPAAPDLIRYKPEARSALRDFARKIDTGTPAPDKKLTAAIAKTMNELDGLERRGR
jgi:hypothetical protein